MTLNMADALRVVQDDYVRAIRLELDKPLWGDRWQWDANKAHRNWQPIANNVFPRAHRTMRTVRHRAARVRASFTVRYWKDRAVEWGET